MTSLGEQHGKALSLRFFYHLPPIPLGSLEQRSLIWSEERIDPQQGGTDRGPLLTEFPSVNAGREKSRGGKRGWRFDPVEGLRGGVIWQNAADKNSFAIEQAARA